MPADLVRRLRYVGRKVRWGAGEVGAARGLGGLGQLAALRIRRPASAMVRARRSGLEIGFRYPEQLIPTLVLFGDLLEPELAVLHGQLAPGRTAVDVGASIGTWTMSAAQTGAEVHACEPDPDNIEVLTENIRRNRQRLPGRVAVHHIAISDFDGSGGLVRAGRRYLNRVEGAEGTTGDDEPSGGGPADRIRVATLASFAADLGLDSIDVLKVNTAGSEREVLLGALDLFRRRRIGLALFLDGLRVRPCLDALRAYGYEIGVFDGAHEVFVPVQNPNDLDSVWPSPMNHYVLARRCDQPERVAAEPERK